MPKRKQSSSVLSIVAYTPPQLYVGVEWYIGFMAFDPAKGKMRRKKIKLNHISKIGERRIYAKDLINRLSEQLRRGWNPWIERESALSYVFIDDAIEHFFRIQKNIWMMTLSEKLLMWNINQRLGISRNTMSR